MASRKLSRSISLATKSAQLALAAPQVMAHRMSRMALAGTNYSDHDLQELARMGSEKQTAFLASWNAMALQALRYQHTFVLAWFQAVWMPWARSRMSPASLAKQLQSATMATLLSGLGPVHHTAVANAKRLSRKQLR